MSSQAWKDANYDRNITVSEDAIQELRDRGTKEANLEYYKTHGATSEQREALNRFYGKDASSGIGASSSDSANAREGRASDPSPSRPNAREDERLGRTPGNSFGPYSISQKPGLTSTPSNVQGVGPRMGNFMRGLAHSDHVGGLGKAAGGAVFGGVLGAAVGGPLGAAGGAALGALGSIGSRHSGSRQFQSGTNSPDRAYSMSRVPTIPGR